MEVELKYIINKLKGSIFEKMPEIVQYYLYWIKWLLLQENYHCKNEDIPFIRFYNLYKKATIRFLLEDIKGNDKAFELYDKLPNILDCLKCYEYRDFLSYKKHKEFIGEEIINYLLEDISENVFVQIINKDLSIRQMMKDQINYKEQEEKLNKIQHLYEKGTKESLEEIEKLCSISTVEENINKLKQNEKL